MDGKQSRGDEKDRPIAKPSYPLPAVFTPRRRTDKQSWQKPSSASSERAYFYRKGTGTTGSPIYGFVITSENPESEARQD